MKAYRYLLFAVLLMTASLAVMTGCEYDVAEPQWDKPYVPPPTPVITQINPAASANAGVNLITILGENFAELPDTNGVYFDNVPADLVATSATSVTVRRPNLVTDSCTVMIVPPKALVVAKYGPYKITAVTERYGGFLSNVILSAIAVDQAENLYVVESATRNIDKVTPTGQNTVVGVATRVPTDARIGPGGNLYLLGNNRSIDVVNLVTGVVKEWRKCPSGKLVKVGDFDANGYFYTGGSRSDLVTITPDSTFRIAGIYTGSSEILAVRVFSGYVYVAVRATNQSPGIVYRHPIDASGNLGTQEKIVDLSTITQFASRLIKGITFSADGTMYIGTDSPDPILNVDPTTKEVDIFYKGILASYCKMFYWGSGNYLYMMRGDTNLNEEWTIYRIDMGTAGAPYYGG